MARIIERDRGRGELVVYIEEVALRCSVTASHLSHKIQDQFSTEFSQDAFWRLLL